VFNRHGFGPPSGDYPDFNLAMGRSPGFGSAPADSPKCRVQNEECRMGKGGLLSPRTRSRRSPILHAAFFTLHFGIAPCSDSVSLRLRTTSCLTLPANATRRFILQKARHHKGLPPRSDCL